MSAESFDLATRVVEDNKLMLCHSNYKGPKTILYNEDKQCITSIKGATNDKTNMILVPSEVAFENNKEFNVKTQYWTKDVCEERERIDAHEIIHIKHSTQYNYICCASLNISTYNRTIPCPDGVFVLPANQSFKIEDMVYDSRQLNLHSELHFMSELTYRVNYQLDPHIVR
jgi:hypothetical protein